MKPIIFSRPDLAVLLEWKHWNPFELQRVDWRALDQTTQSNTNKSWKLQVETIQIALPSVYTLESDSVPKLRSLLNTFIAVHPTLPDNKFFLLVWIILSYVNPVNVIFVVFSPWYLLLVWYQFLCLFPWFCLYFSIFQYSCICYSRYYTLSLTQSFDISE